MFSLRNEEEAFFIMKVLKFGGSSVGTPESILNVKNIVEATAPRWSLSVPWVALRTNSLPHRAWQQLAIRLIPKVSIR